jgi:ATP-dependent Clp endopeptidase proteolytic subunit ClpP
MSKEKLQLAKASALEAEARKTLAEALAAEARAAVAQLELNRAVEKEGARLADDDHNRVYRFLGGVTGASSLAAVAQLVEWNRLDPGCDITFIIDSPGGGIIEGFHLFDVMLSLRKDGHHITTITNGMAASMGGILLQAGDRRIAGPNASILIHEASFGAMGSMGQVEDTVEFAKKLQERLLGILAERSSLTKTQIRNRWKRKNWWLDADEALKFGFVDAIE